LRLTHAGDVLEQRSYARLHRAATVRSSRNLILLTDEGVQVLDCSDWSVRGIEEA
jgi:hypothetical protein